jgi:DNA-binding transcriptional MerR regulator
MTDKKQTGQIDLQSLRIQAAHHEGLEIAKLLTARSQNHVGALAVLEAQKAMAEEARDELKKKVAALEAALAEARGEVSGEPMAGKDGKAGKPAR